MGCRTSATVREKGETMNPLRGSIYSARDGEPGNPFGEFRNQRILGQACTIRAKPSPDRSPPHQDKLGWPMRRGGVAIHVSGLDPFGKKTGPGFIRELGLYGIDWLGRDEHPSGLGCNGDDPVALLTWDDVHRRRDSWAHHAFWGHCSGYVSFDGVWNLIGPDKPFMAIDVCSEMDRRRPGYDYTERQHVSAVRRLLENMVGVSNPSAGAIVQDPSRPSWGSDLKRVGRWGYFWPRLPSLEVPCG